MRRRSAVGRRFTGANIFVAQSKRKTHAVWCRLSPVAHLPGTVVVKLFQSFVVAVVVLVAVVVAVVEQDKDDTR